MYTCMRRYDNIFLREKHGQYSLWLLLVKTLADLEKFLTIFFCLYLVRSNSDAYEFTIHSGFDELNVICILESIDCIGFSHPFYLFMCNELIGNIIRPTRLLAALCLQLRSELKIHRGWRHISSIQGWRK